MRHPTPDPVGPLQESVWDYPRPPALECTDDHVVVEFAGRVVVDTRRPWRVLETSHPPTYYVPREDVVDDAVTANARTSFCEFKGHATYLDVVGPDGRRAEAAAWSYPSPSERFAGLADAVAFYPAMMDRCLVDDEVARAVQGDFYGGWVTSRIVGPFKGEVEGSRFW